MTIGAPLQLHPSRPKVPGPGIPEERQGRRRLSLVIPCYNESEVLPLLRHGLQDLCRRLEEHDDVEVILVDDGSADCTWEQIQDFAAADPRVRGIRLSRNFGHQAAITCGYEAATGDVVISMDADLQDPPEVIFAMLQRWREGAEIVYAIRNKRLGETHFKLLTARLFYRFIRALGAEYVRHDCGDFRLVSRRALDVLNAMPERHRFIRGLVGWIGFQTAEVHFDRPARAAGKTKYSLTKLVRLAADGIVSFSRAPLRLPYYLALVLSTVFLAYLGYAAVKYFVFGAERIPGWGSLILPIVLFGAANLLGLAILGEYVGRIYEQCKERPMYIVRESAGFERVSARKVA
jgi:dolichol-phosphate mannosyltransferase